MSELSPRRHRWSWRSCFAAVKHNKKKSKKQRNHQSNLQTSSNGHTDNKRLLAADRNAQVLSEFGLASSHALIDDYTHHSTANGYHVKTGSSSNEHHNHFRTSDNVQQIVDSINSKIINSKAASTARMTPLDAIVEDSSEETADEFEDTGQSARSCNDRDLVNNSSVLHSRLFDLSKMNHIMTQFNDNGYFLGEFACQLKKLKLKIDAIKRTTTERPLDAELLEAKYSTLLATIECLSLLLKVAQISSSRSFINRLMFSIEERMEQLNKLVQLSSSISMRPKQQDLIDDDLPSFRSALSSYEHLLTQYLDDDDDDSFI